MRLLKDNGLTIVLLTLFALSIGGQWVTGCQVANAHALRHGQPAMALASYTLSPEFLFSVFENWESELLQMSAYVLLTAFLIQRGSAESRDPDAPPRDADLARNLLAYSAADVRETISNGRTFDYEETIALTMGNAYGRTVPARCSRSSRTPSAATISC